MYSLPIAYLLWLCSGCGALGLHRFYLGKIPSGVLWMCSGGLFGIGSIYDFFTLPGQVREANFRKALTDGDEEIHRIAGQQTRYISESRSAREKVSVEHAILTIAKENKGILSVSDVALGADISIDEAKKCLDLLVSKGFAELRVRRSGSLVYAIPDMLDKDEPLEEI